MPSGPKKRKAAKRKKFKDSSNSNSSSTTHSHHGDCDGGEFNSDQHNNQLPFLEVEKHEEGLPHNESLQVGSTEIVDEGNIAINGKRSKYEEEMRMVPDLDKSSFLEQRFFVNGSASDSKDNLPTSLGVESSLVEIGAAASVCAGCVNEQEMSQYSDKQPLVACTQPAMQTTSWKGCCGILELLSSSDQ